MSAVLDAWLRSQPSRCDGCGMHVQTMGCSCAGLAAKAKGQAIVSAAHPDDRSKVEAAIRTLAATGKPFSSNDCRPLHGVSGPVVGAAFTAAAKAGLIRRIGYVASTEPGTHAHPVAEWVAA
jgi:hypothetical protein